MKTESPHSLHEHLRWVLDQLTLPHHPSDGEIHAIRTELKRSRAALRLMRGATGDAPYRRGNRRLRDAGRSLRQVRDTAAILKKIQKLQTDNSDGPVNEYCIRFKDLLIRRRNDWRQKLNLPESWHELWMISDIAEDLTQQPARMPEHASIEKGFRRCYRAGRRAMRVAARDDDLKAWHEWRKQVKYLANQAELVRLISGPKFRRLRRRADKLAELLGDDHDLAIIEVTAQQPQTCRALGEPPAALLKRIRAERRRLRAKIEPAGRRLYGQSDQQFKKWARRKLAALTAPD